MHVATSDVDRLHVPRVSSGKGLQYVWDGFQASMCRLSDYFHHSESEMIKVCSVIDSKNLLSTIKRASEYSLNLKVAVMPLKRTHELRRRHRLRVHTPELGEIILMIAREVR